MVKDADWMVSEDEMLERLGAWVDQNSHTGNKPGGDRMGEQLSEAFTSLGMTASRIPSARFADHWIFSTEAAASSTEGAIVLVGHHDTVFPKGTFEGFRHERGAPIARGPGVLDMKGGLVIEWAALRALHAKGDLHRRPIRVVIVGDEEVGSPEGKTVIEEAAKGARAALVFEAGRAHDRIITQRKGTGSVTVIAKGKAAHAANGHREGVNAIWALSEFVSRAQRLTDYDLGVTINVGVIRGGETKNTVPDHAEGLLDFRFQRPEDAADLWKRFEDAARAAEEAVLGSVLTLSGGVLRAPLARTGASQALMEAYGRAALAEGLGAEEAPLISGGSDANTTSSLGIPSIDGLGPRGTGFHTHDECIEVSSLVPKTRALIRWIVGEP